MQTTAKSYDDLPLTISAPELAKILGISRAGAYDLMNSPGFPVLRHRKRMMVNKFKLIEWINKNSASMGEQPIEEKPLPSLEDQLMSMLEQRAMAAPPKARLVPNERCL